jgi:hypothetical protein
MVSGEVTKNNIIVFSLTRPLNLYCQFVGVFFKENEREKRGDV